MITTQQVTLTSTVFTLDMGDMGMVVYQGVGDLGIK